MTVQNLMAWQSRQAKSSHDYVPMLTSAFSWRNQFTYVVDCHRGEIVETAGDARAVLGYSNDEIDNIQDLYEPILRNNLEPVLGYTKAMLKWIFHDPKVDFINTFSQYGYCIKNKQGRISRIMRQGACARVENGKVTHTVCTLTDVSSIDSRRYVTVKALGPTAYRFDPEIPELAVLNKEFSRREIEILRLVAHGKTSRDIGAILHISKHTVDTHRRNMIRKLDVSNSIELINLASDIGLI